MKILLISLLSITILFGQGVTKRALFIGNSYTSYNDLPSLVADVALSEGDTLIHDSYTPGGYTLQQHANDPMVEAKIQAGGWDYLILQQQYIPYLNLHF